MIVAQPYRKTNHVFQIFNTLDGIEIDTGYSTNYIYALLPTVKGCIAHASTGVVHVGFPLLLVAVVR